MRDLPERSDEELLAEAGRENRPAFAAFFDRHAGALWRFLSHHLGSEADAEDVLQQTFLAAWRGAAGARVEHGARPWLFTIARHAAERAGRRRRRREAHEASLETLGEAAGFACVEFTPEHVAEALEEKDLLEAALGALEPEEREVIVMRDIEGWSGQEAADVLGLTLAAQKSRLHRARLRLAAEVRRRVSDGNAGTSAGGAS